MTTNGKLTWTNCRVKLGDLKPWAQNPRMSTKAQARRILQSLDDFGQVQTVAIGPDSTVYDGHQRLSALLTVHGPDYELDARRSSRELSEVEHRALVIALHAGAMGAWDWNGLSGWDAKELGAWGMDVDLLREWNNDANNLREMLQAEGEPLDMDAAWQGMPEFEQEDLKSFRHIIVHFKSQADIDSFSTLVSQKILEHTKYIWYPKAELLDMDTIVYHDKP